MNLSDRQKIIWEIIREYNNEKKAPIISTVLYDKIIGQDFTKDTLKKTLMQLKKKGYIREGMKIGGKNCYILLRNI